MSQPKLENLVKKVCKVSKEEAKKIAEYISDQKVMFSICEEPSDYELLSKNYD
jgi:hypothetical protein